MAGILTEERSRDRAVQRRVQDGEIRAITTNPSTIRKWLRALKDGGLRALIDGRSLRARKSFDRIESRYREAAVQEVDALDGDKSMVADAEIHRRALVQLKDDGAEGLVIPQRLSGEFISQLRKQRGATPRAQRSNRLRETSGTQHFPAIRPGQVVAIDATRADNLVYSPLERKTLQRRDLHGDRCRTRVVVALRVTPRSADGIDAAADGLRHLSPILCRRAGTTMTDWRWVGLPGAPRLVSYSSTWSDASCSRQIFRRCRVRTTSFGTSGRDSCRSRRDLCLQAVSGAACVPLGLICC